VPRTRSYKTIDYTLDCTLVANKKSHRFALQYTSSFRCPTLNMAYSQPFPLAAPQSKAPKELTFGPDLAVRLICPDCRDPNPHIVEEFGSGDLVCGACGLVLGDRIVDTRSEWRVSLKFSVIPGTLSLHVLLLISCLDVRQR